MGKKLLILVPLLAVLVLVIVWAVQAVGDAPHEFKENCTLCHVGLKDPTILTRSVNNLAIPRQQKGLIHPI